MATNRPACWMIRNAALCLVVLAATALPSAARSLSFDERAAAQWAIEEVYWRHRTWPEANRTPKPDLSSVLSDEAVRAKVEDYLKKSNALEKWWRRPVTGERLQAELDRMSRDTRAPALLRELYAALGNDASLVAETFGRQTLVERLVRDRYARDDRLHGGLERNAREALAGIRGVAEMSALGGRYAETTYLRRAKGERPSNDDRDEPVVELEAEDWKAWEARLAASFGTTANELPLLRLSSLREDGDRFSVVAILERTDGALTVASVIWPKRPFDAWWEEQAPLLAAEAEADPWRFTLAEPSGTGCVVDTWRERYYAPAARSDHTAVWTGTEMIVWGGGLVAGTVSANTGGRYDPSTDSWVPTSTGSAPAARHWHTAVWTGREMIVWGGYGGGQYLDSGGRYDPLSDSWTPIGSLDAPARRFFHTAVWTGTEMIVWGGGRSTTEYFNDGGRYDPDTNTWLPTSMGANVPDVRKLHTAVWTGSEMIVWGGLRGVGVSYYHDTGGRYDPSTDTWLPTSVGANVPEARLGAATVWTGTEMIVWGGYDGEDLDTGGRYDSSTDTWASTSTGPGRPTPRQGHTAVWTGTEMVVWGGSTNTGGRYDPAADTWLPTSTGIDVPSWRYSHTAVWTGTEMIVWGGSGDNRVNSGGRYDPSTDEWVSTSPGIEVPTPRHDHSAVWTGAEMIVWGGYGDGGYLNTGGRYDQSTDTWFPTSMGTNSPAGRYHHTAVWTGTEMIVWGGSNPNPRNDGGRYDPSTNRWLPTSTGTNVPSGRRNHTAVWTGTEMIVWGGGTYSFHRTGGRYAPSTDSWLPTSTGAAVPTPRRLHTAVWTGTEMVVWGGYNRIDDVDYYYYSGGRYDPSTDSWRITAAAPNAPPGREEHTAVWTGTEMLVWGGYDGQSCLNEGSLYDPAANLWTHMSDDYPVPSKRLDHAAVWTGKEMIVWGGRDEPHYAATVLDNGGRYDLLTDTWVRTTITDAPLFRYDHSAVWTGTEMIVWGGTPGSTNLGFYCASSCTGPAMTYRDADGDGHGDPAVFVVTDGCSIPPGYVAVPGDCDDGDAAIHSGAEEINDGKDNQCPGDVGYGVADEISGNAGFRNPADRDEYSWQAQPGASSYQVARSSQPDFSTDCATATGSETYWADSSPVPLNACFYYMVRPLTPHAGSWGQDSAGIERILVCP